ncbi:MAG: choice-of-anchor D domain-containing protein, partial [Candidatus Kapabacteria bacterium]|nr:choice-of-anchor D domain-containing protein [Candidatus Kapabacteria bacterium]
YIDRNNRCGTTVFLKKIDITRETDLRSSVDSLDMGIVKVQCQEEPYKEKTFQICNNTNRTGTNLDKIITGFKFGKPKFFEVINPINFPITILPGQCIDIKVRFNAGDSSVTYFDTLNIVSNDNCPGGGKIPVKGSIEQVLRLDKFGQKNKKADSMDFGTICVGYFAQAQLYVWENLSSSQIQVTGFLLPKYFESSSTKLPFNLDVKTSYRERYIRFAPTVAGTFQDSVVILVKSGSCTVRRVIYVKGRAIDTKLDFKVTSVDFGNTVVGQEKTLNVDVTNLGNEQINVQFYLKSGSAFFLTGTRSLTLVPNQTSSFPITFRPISDTLYLDEVCYFEVKCFESKCIPIKGKGVYERFLFEPEEMRVESVIACGSQLDTLFIKNNSGTTETLSTFVLSDPGGKFSVVDPPFNSFSVTLKDQEKQRFIFNYIPNDIINDRADRAFLKYKTADLKDWAAKLYGTSAIPKMFLSDNTAYGTIEVGDSKRKIINLENISALPITIDSLASDSGFVIIYPLNIKGRVFYPRDTIQITVDFKPNYPVDYDGFIYAFSLNPCKNSVKGIVSGKGKIVPLEINTTIVAYGFVKPCDCFERKLAMANNSSVIDATIDSIFIDGKGIVGAYPEFFKWKSDNSPNGTFPFKIPFSTVDTLRVFYCPRSLALRDSIVHSAQVHIKSSGSGWTLNFDRFVTGKQMLFQEPFPLTSNFPPTRVNFPAKAIYNRVTIPGIDVNPSRDGLTIDSITFIPDDLVFIASDSLKRPFPITLIGNDTFKIKIDFKPKAPRQYNSRMVIHYSKPCITNDTTIVVTGSGFAPAFGLGIAFNPVGTQLDTINIISCDTLFLPIYSNRKIPANAVDIICRVGYDTTLFKYVGATSEYLKTNCINIPPKISDFVSKYGGTEIRVENFCQVDSIKPFLIAKFLAKQRKSVGTLFTVDSITFDTKDVILYQIIAQNDKIFITTQNSDFKIDNTANFDSVRVLDCVDRDITITNTGEVKIAVNEFITYPNGVTLISSIPAKDVLIAPGESATLTLRYCPKKKSVLEDSLFYETIKPCYTKDSTQIFGIGYAPELNISSDVSTDFIAIDKITANIGDTIIVPIYFEKDLSATYKGVTYWIQKFSFNVNINYNPTALKFISGEQTINSNFNLNYSHGKIDLSYKNVDTLKAGIIAQLKFLLTIPDSVSSDMNINATNFTSDSLLFLDLIGRRNLAIITNNQQCNINTIIYTNKVPLLNQNYPNPWTDATIIEFSTIKRGVIDFKLYSSTGNLVKEYFNDGKSYKPGNYSISIKKDELESGTYFYELKTGINKFQKMMIHTK